MMDGTVIDQRPFAPAELFCREAGSGSAVVCVHCNASSSSQWRPLMDRLVKEIHAVMNDPEFRASHVTARSLVPAINTPEQFADEIAKNRATARQVVKDAGLEPQ